MMEKIDRSAAESMLETSIFPLRSNEIRPASKSASKLATRGRPLSGSRRSSFDELRHGLMWDARMASSVADQVTAQRFPQAFKTCDRKSPWPTRAFTNASLVVESIFWRPIALKSSVNSPSAVRGGATSLTGTRSRISAKVLPPSLVIVPKRIRKS